MREFTYLTDGGFSVEGDGHKFKPWGFAGGADGSPSALIQITSGGEKIRVMRQCVDQTPPLDQKKGEAGHIAACWFTE